MNNEYGIIAPDRDLEAEKVLVDTADAVEFTTQTQGWKYIKDFVDQKKDDFANKVLNNDLKDITEVAYQRGYVKGLLALLAEVESLIAQKERIAGK